MNKKNVWIAVIMGAALFGLFTACGEKIAPVDTSGLPPALTAAGTERISFPSNLLKKDMGLYIHLPQGFDSTKEYPVVYLLHGFGNTEIEWFEYHGLHTLADTLTAKGSIPPMILVAVQMDNSWGIDTGEPKQLSTNARNSLYSGPYETYMVHEVLPVVEQRYPVMRQKEGRTIAGISMGGFAALHIGLRNRKVFGSIAAHSPALRGQHVPDWFMYAPDRPAEKNDPILLASRLKQGQTRIWLDCGEQDGLLPGVEEMKTALEDNDWSIRYSTKPGKHNQDYWLSRLSDYLAFYGDATR